MPVPKGPRPYATETLRGWRPKRADAAILAAPKRPWLVVGKGPTAGLVHRVDRSGWNVMSLNHACTLPVPLAIAHFVDLSALRDCKAVLTARPDVTIVLPWRPHVHFKPGPTLCEQSDQVIAFLERYDRVAAYNVPGVPRPHPDLPAVRLRKFSAVGAVALLAACDVKTVYTAGVDGGTEYAPGFDRKDLLANGQPNFDGQFAEFRRIEKIYGVRIVPLAPDDHCPIED